MDYQKIDDFVLGLVRRSTPGRTAWNLEKIREGKPASWNYIDGCMLTALMEMEGLTGNRQYFDFVKSCADHFVEEDGSIRTFKPEAHNLDDINEGRVLFSLYARTGEEKYRRAADFLRGRLDAQPRTSEGNFWHKAIYPNQVWLDGIYMAQPFYAMYEKHFGGGNYSDLAGQIENVRANMFSQEKGLYFHGYDASRTAFWADPATGCSKNFWLRSLGWFAVALADLLDILPLGQERNRLGAIFTELMASMTRYADGETGLYWQVPDQGNRDGNYLETSGSAMMAYAMLKGARLGALGEEYAALGQKTFDGIVDKYLTFTENKLNLGGICLVAGLGPEDNRRRDGSYEYYISEPVVENDAKGVAPFVLAYTEIKRLGA
ncbi:MAG: glycosyl hydrolase family 88 [Oscillospiraceae bacterium]|jgi:unsaturated rhamnogalacturonyl hydrolase|nr:glycosyl hydrolase family 88 [Oscillospiraceae bacterium]